MHHYNVPPPHPIPDIKVGGVLEVRGRVLHRYLKCIHVKVLAAEGEERGAILS